MNEERFRTLMREVVGDAPASPWLNDAVRKHIAQPVRRESRAPLPALLAAFVALAVLAGVIITPHLLNRYARATPGVQTPGKVDPYNCTLPVMLMTWGSGGTQTASAGFVSTATGKFAMDPKASVAGLPDGIGPAGTVRNSETPLSSYSSPTRRWVPVPPNDLSPDGRSYVYIVYLPAAQQPSGRSAYGLIRYDIATRKSTRLWTAAFGIQVVKWTTRGVLLNANTSYRGGPNWLVNPSTGDARPVQLSTEPMDLIGAPPFNHGAGIRTPGLTSAGETIYVVFARDRKTVWAFYDTVDGRRVFIFKGSESVTSGFELWTALADGSGIWFTSPGTPPTVWHWDESDGLRQFTVDIPHDPGSLIQPVGACFSR